MMIVFHSRGYYGRCPSRGEEEARPSESKRDANLGQEMKDISPSCFFPRCIIPGLLLFPDEGISCIYHVTSSYCQNSHLTSEACWSTKQALYHLALVEPQVLFVLFIKIRMKKFTNKVYVYLRLLFNDMVYCKLAQFSKVMTREI